MSEKRETISRDLLPTDNTNALPEYNPDPADFWELEYEEFLTDENDLAQYYAN